MYTVSVYSSSRAEDLKSAREERRKKVPHSLCLSIPISNGVLICGISIFTAC
jgi:hypothetical protein